MPELPEVETVVRDLRPHLPGRRIASVRVGKLSLRRRWSRAWGPQLIGRKIVRLGRRGKWILLVLEGDFCLVIHLGMTGQLTLAPASQAPAEHTHLVFGLDPGPDQLRFRDIRRFGSATLFKNEAEVKEFFEAARLGPEPFDLDPNYWKGCLSATSRCLKAVLLDQQVVAGVGNIYADEALFVAGLSPTRLGRDLDSSEAERLRKAVATVLKRAISRRGSTIRNYVGGCGLEGKYQREFRVYQRTGKPCVRCGTPVQRLRLAGRSTHFCPHCQAVPLPASHPDEYSLPPSGRRGQRCLTVPSSDC